MQAEESERKRSHYNFHDSLDDPVQRLCVALKRETYIRPHKHPEPKWELFIVLKGHIMVHIYDDEGLLQDKVELSANGENSGIEIPFGTWHTLLPVDGDAVIMGFKQGPYIPAKKQDFAQWSPEEGDEKVAEYLLWAADAAVGQKFN